MGRPGAHGFRQPLEWVARTLLPHWKEVLLLITVAVMVACCVAFVGLRLQTLTEARAGMEPDRIGEVDGLPDVLGNRCSKQAPERL